MKLSQKLLALGGVALADYACCPYDDYGMPHDACVTALPEKTPFSMETDWRDGACKAWEANVDATYDGNDSGCGNQNWGSCGFQRHFQWNSVNDYTTMKDHSQGCTIAEDGSGVIQDSDANANACTCHVHGLTAFNTAEVAAGNDVDYCTDDAGTATVGGCSANQLAANDALPDCTVTDFFGMRNMKEIDIDTSGTFYDGTGTLNVPFGATQTQYNLGGVPFLGGVCKLFVPVPLQRIVSVQVAGVHVNTEAQSVYPARYTTSTSDPAGVASNYDGTAYCFSVVNPAEANINDNNIHNGNVAGDSRQQDNAAFNEFPSDAFDGMTSLQRQAGINPDVQFFDGGVGYGTVLHDNSLTNAEGDSEVGANFDVVVHIHSSWCNSPSFWNVQDMQLAGDFDNGNLDYPLNQATDLVTLATYTGDSLGDDQATCKFDNTVSSPAPLCACNDGLTPMVEGDIGGPHANCDDPTTCTEDDWTGFQALTGCSHGAYDKIMREDAVDFSPSATFTHAHMDLMDKRHNFIMDTGSVYADSGNGYLNWPQTIAPEPTPSYLRWPNAGAFAAFHSFVSCANPVDTPFDGALTVADANKYAYIYPATCADGDTPADNAAFAAACMNGRQLVMSVSDSDYRDEACTGLQFRANVRQVGSTITNCGPGQLPDTDGKRCTWNWNYNSSYNAASPMSNHEQDAEGWFDRNDPHNFNTWSTRKRRSELNRKTGFNQGYWGVLQGDVHNFADSDGDYYLTEGDYPLAWDNSAGALPMAWDDSNDQLRALIEVPVTDFQFRMNFKDRYGRSVGGRTIESNVDCDLNAETGCVCNPIEAANVDDDTGDVTSDYCAIAPCTSDETDFAATLPSCDRVGSDTHGYLVSGTNTLAFDDDRITAHYTAEGWQASVVCNDVPTQAGLSATQSQRDNFPDCFFGDEIWFTLTYDLSADGDGSGPWDGVTTDGTEGTNDHSHQASAWFTTTSVEDDETRETAY